jgi:predicted small lipoprotein YifL
MLRALSTTLAMTALALAACGGATSEELPPLKTAKGDGLPSYEVEDEDEGNRVCETVQENVPDELKGEGAVKIVLPDGSTYTRCELPP